MQAVHRGGPHPTPSHLGAETPAHPTFSEEFEPSWAWLALTSGRALPCSASGLGSFPHVPPARSPAGFPLASLPTCHLWLGQLVLGPGPGSAWCRSVSHICSGGGTMRVLLVFQAQLLLLLSWECHPRGPLHVCDLTVTGWLPAAQRGHRGCREHCHVLALPAVATATPP